MRFEPRHAFLAVEEPERTGASASGSPTLPAQIAFLAGSRVEQAVLHAVARQARHENVCAARVVIAEGHVSASFFYQKLAAHLGLPFVADWPRIDPSTDPATAHRAGRVRLAGSKGWLVAPEDDALRALFEDKRDTERDERAITTPAHLAALIHFGAQEAVARAARDALPTRNQQWSARGAADVRAALVAATIMLCCVYGIVDMPRLVGDLFGLLFFAGIIMRLVLGAVGFATPPDPSAPVLSDADLPDYTVLVPLRQEAEVVPDLLKALDAIDYPRAKLQILVLVEPEDLSTRHALASARLPPCLHVILGPIEGGLRTKPRALNIGLLMARGQLLTVYDAEDRPAPDQLRLAAEAFAAAPPTLACLQAHLLIENGATSLLAQLFMIEYAVLFDILNVGTAHLGLPMALGGTSNHFRVSTLHAVGGWDAWNVAEDADLGLRLARLGYGVGHLPSTTIEAAPDRLPIWMKQRRRWTKGWMQTFLVLARDPRGILRRLGYRRFGALALLFVNLLIGPLLYPLFCGLVTYDVLAFGLPEPQGALRIGEATLAVCVLGFGAGSTLWLGYAGLRARRRLHFWPSLPLLLPYQLLISAAAWMGLHDLVVRPHHWHKTPHRPSTGSPETSIVHRP